MTTLDQARSLGVDHGSKRDVPYAPDGDVAGYEPWHPDGYVSYVYWDAGSADLMTALGETTETTADNWEERGSYVRAYCEAYAEAAGIPFDTSA